jgi:hypothetical protein
MLVVEKESVVPSNVRPVPMPAKVSMPFASVRRSFEVSVEKIVEELNVAVALATRGLSR